MYTLLRDRFFLSNAVLKGERWYIRHTRIGNQLPAESQAPPTTKSRFPAESRGGYYGPHPWPPTWDADESDTNLHSAFRVLALHRPDLEVEYFVVDTKDESKKSKLVSFLPAAVTDERLRLY